MSGIWAMLGITMLAWVLLALDTKKYNRRKKDHEK